MYTVAVSEYPKNKEWNDKISSTPNIPGGKNTLFINLTRREQEISYPL